AFGAIGAHFQVVDEVEGEAWAVLVTVWVSDEEAHRVRRLGTWQYDFFVDGPPDLVSADPDATTTEAWLMRNVPRIPSLPSLDGIPEGAVKDRLRQEQKELEAQILQVAVIKETARAAHLSFLEKFGETLLYTTLMTHSLLACRNVATQDHRQDHAKRSQRSGSPGVRYKTLQISPFGGRNSSGSSNNSADIMPLHIVRGHFKTYTPERPLFGSVTGTFWWTPNVRGKEKNGVVIKDYKMGKVYAHL